MKSEIFLIEDVLNQLIDEVLILKKDAEDEFDKGVIHGYYFTIQRILNQTQAFGISEHLSARLKNFNVEDIIN